MNFFSNLIIKKTRLNLFVMVQNSPLCHKGGGIPHILPLLIFQLTDNSQKWVNAL